MSEALTHDQLVALAVDEPTVDPKVAQKQLRDRWLAALRAQGRRQCVGAFVPELHMVCALTLLGEIVYGNYSQAKTAHDACISVMREKFCILLPFYAELGDMVGLSRSQVGVVMGANDGQYDQHGRRANRKNFREIADMIEGWFR